MPTVVAFETLTELFLNLRKKYQGTQKTAFARKLTTEGEYQTITWDQVSDDAHTLAAYLIEHGVEAGDRVAILSENRYEWAVVDLALQLIGGVNVSLYTSLPPNQCEYILQNSEAKIFFVSTGIQLKKARQVFDNCENLNQVIAFDEPNISSYLDDAYVQLFDKVMTEGGKLLPKNEEKIKERSKAISAEDLATLIYTSGTTGKPKGAMLT
ncbi:MAG TPA: AMP-binding protein, partial [Bacteroidales bacterium]|nr:AMP-binding protein [Bacteroidales bacterium]